MEFNWQSLNSEILTLEQDTDVEFEILTWNPYFVLFTMDLLIDLKKRQNRD